MANPCEIRHERIPCDGLELHVARAGAGPPVILLHGFPECWLSWRRQIEPLVAAGYSVLAPDLRGYNLSDRPSGLAAYHLTHLVEDVACLVRATGCERAHVVGHDWGGVIAWSFAGRHPELLDKLVILNAPHPYLYFRKARRPPQLYKSWYVLFFQLPWLPEWSMSVRNYARVRRMFRRMPWRAGTFTEFQIDEYVQALSRPGALTAMLNYYRAGVQLPDGLLRPRLARTAAETLVIWGEHDPALDLCLLEDLDQVAPRSRIHRLPDAGHWVQNEAPNEVNQALLEFLKA